MKREKTGILLFVILLVVIAATLTGCGGGSKTPEAVPTPTAEVTATPTPEKSSKLEGSWICDGVGRLDFEKDGSLVVYNASDSTKETLKYTLAYPADNPKAIDIKLGTGETETAVFSDDNTFVINDLTYTRSTEAESNMDPKALIIGKWDVGSGSSMELKENGEIIFIEDGKESKEKYSLIEDPGTPNGIGIKLSDRDAELFIFSDENTIVNGDTKMTRIK